MTTDGQAKKNVKIVGAITNLTDGGKEIINSNSRLTEKHEKMEKNFSKNGTISRATSKQ